MRWKTLAVLAAVLCQAPHSADAQVECEGEGFHRLDFWQGEWVVTSGGQEVGTNRIIAVLGGCAIEEHWTASGGDEGQSLFYYLSALDEWRQVWVTEHATRPGGVKEKREVERFPDGGLRFQGEIPLESGRSYLDRTTLTPLDGDRVRQVIEISRDGGVTWRTTFDAIYERASG
jgi:hypothetical protein